LGVDLVEFKTCTYDCIYCQLGRTTNRTVKRTEYVPLECVVNEVASKLNVRPLPDYVTLSGSGEPTLHSRLGELIAAIKKISTIPVAVLTNGSLLRDRHVRKGLLQADLVIPSLDAGNDRLFQYVNRPHPRIRFAEMLEGLVEFRREFPKPIWLEVFILSGVTTVDSEVSKIVQAVERILPDRVQLNTVTRPPAESYAMPASREVLERIARRFPVETEVIGGYHGALDHPSSRVTADGLLALLKRRPCTLLDLADGLGVHPNEVLKEIGCLLEGQLVRAEVLNGTTFYRSAESGV
jgi:wyosine [tRNA(Phe)-imidazoG37] synthetase (radical SAM superfamily)